MRNKRLLLLIAGGAGLAALANQAVAKTEVDHWSPGAAHRERLVVAGNSRGSGGKLAIPPKLPSAPQLKRAPSGALPDYRQGPRGRSNQYPPGSAYCEQNPKRPPCLRRAPVRDPCRQNSLRRECLNQVKAKNP